MKHKLVFMWQKFCLPVYLATYGSAVTRVKCPIFLCNIPNDWNLHQHRCEHLISRTIISLLFCAV
jgi:hypothetical protein